MIPVRFTLTNMANERNFEVYVKDDTDVIFAVKDALARRHEDEILYVEILPTLLEPAQRTNDADAARR